MNWYAPIDKLNRLSDHIEDRYLPRWLQYNVVGDPVSWYFSHPAWVLIGAKVGALVGWIADQFIGFVLPDWKIGAVVGAWFVVAVYAFIREPLSAWESYQMEGWDGAFQRLHRNRWCSGVQVGWLVDGVMDVVGPVVTALLISWLLL